MGFCTSSSQQGVKYQLCYLDFGGPYEYPMTNSQRTAKFFFHLGFESKVLPGPLTGVSAMGGIMHLKPTAVCQISTLIFGFLGGTLWISHEKLPKNGKVLSHLEFKWKVLPGPSTDLSAWVVFYTSSPQQGVKYQLCYLYFFGGIL